MRKWYDDDDECNDGDDYVYYGGDDDECNDGDGDDYFRYLHNKEVDGDDPWSARPFDLIFKKKVQL